MAGFAAEKHTITFNVQNGTNAAINGAKVTVKKDGTEVADSPYSTNAEGKAAATLEAGEYTYTVTDPSGTYGSKSGSLTVSADAVETVTLPEASEATYPVSVTVTDKDKGGALQGVTVSCGGANDTTNASGGATLNLQAGSRTVQAVKAGYQTGSKTVAVSATQPNTLTIDLLRSRATVKLLVEAETGSAARTAAEPLAGAVITATPQAGTYLFGGSASATTGSDGVAALSLPSGSYDYEVSAPGYSGTISGVMTVTVDNANPNTASTLSLNSNVAQTVDNAQSVSLGGTGSLTPISDALYIIEGTFDDPANPAQLTAKVYLKNINALSGTFGLRYDANLLSLNNFAPETGTWDYMAGTNGAPDVITNNPDDARAGYHAFTWAAPMAESGNASTTIDSEAAQVLLGTYTFDLLQGDSATKKDAWDRLSNNESLFVMPFPLTDNALALQSSPSYVEGMLETYWRTPSAAEDGENYAEALAGALGGGYYQAYKPGSPEDVAVDMHYQITFPETNNIRLEATVTGGEEGPLEGAGFRVFEEAAVDTGSGNIIRPGAAPYASCLTDHNGIAYVSVPKTSPGTTNYYYIVEADGYWPKPGDTDLSKAESTAAQAVGTETVGLDVNLIPKAYYTPGVVKDLAANPLAEQPDARISGGPAYTKLDYYFDVELLNGKVWQSGERPATLPVRVQYQDEAPQDTTASFDAARNLYVLPSSFINRDMPDGSSSLSIGTVKVEVKDSLLTEGSFTVNAKAGVGGTAAPGGDASIGGTVNTVTDGHEYNQADIPAGAASDTFTFTPDEGYCIDSVVINGVEAPFAAEDGTYACKWDSVEADQTVSVTFAKLGEHEGDPGVPENSVVTVVAGEYAQVNVSGAATGTVNALETRSYVLDGTAPVTAVVSVPSALTSDYEVDRILVFDTADLGTPLGAPEVTAATGSVTFTPETGRNYTVVAAVKKTGEAPFQAFVTAQVGRGSGEIAAMGVLPYTIGTTPAFDLTAAEHWYVDGVEQDGAAAEAGDIDWVGGEPYRQAGYTLDPISGDTVVSALFGEDTYKVAGVVQYLQRAGVRSYTKLTFTRTVGNYDQETVIVSTTANSGVSITGEESGNGQTVNFTASLPLGTWSVKVEKNGYLSYTITGFQVTDSAGTQKLGNGGAGNPKPIQPKIGNAYSDYDFVGPRDVTRVLNGLLPGSTSVQADVDEGGSIGVNDLGFVKAAYGDVRTIIEYVAWNADV